MPIFRETFIKRIMNIYTITLKTYLCMYMFSKIILNINYNNTYKYTFSEKTEKIVIIKGKNNQKHP